MNGLLQLIAHLFGDYILQSSWMANNKTKRWVPAIIHACTYFIPFLLLFRPSGAATLIMVVTHLLIDRFRLARFVAFGSNFLAPAREWKKWADCSGTGYYKETPPWLANWLMIIIDNAIHLTINYFALARF